MKRYFLAAALLVSVACSAFGYTILYREQFYGLYHRHYIQYPDDAMENIYWLERALASDFCNPLYALATIPDTEHWERYRDLFTMHLNLKLIEQYLALGSKWEKRIAFFYNAPWKKQNLESLATAETCYKTALAYWTEARSWSGKAALLSRLHLEEVQYWEDESFRVESGDLDYAEIIAAQLARIDKTRGAFQAMDETTY
jgi:hypothetical protein